MSKESFPQVLYNQLDLHTMYIIYKGEDNNFL